MRYIDETIKARLLQAQKTLYNNANPVMEIIASRPQTPINDKRLWQEVIVTPNVTSISTSVAVRKTGDVADVAYVAYVTDANTLVVKSAPIAYPVSSMIWTVVETVSNCTACAIDFDGHFSNLVSREIKYLTDELPWLFYVTTAGALMGGILGSTYETLVASNVTAIDAIRGVASKYKDMDQGLLLFYIIGGDVYYNSLIAGAWEGQQTVSLAPANAVTIHAERTFDWRIVLQVMDNTGKLHEIFTKMEASGWNGTDYIQIINIALVASLVEVFYSDYQDGTENIELASITQDNWLMATYSPTLLSAENLPTEMLDEEDQPYNDYGYLVAFTFDQVIRNAEDFPAAFKLTDDLGMTWFGQEANRVNVRSRTVIVRFTDFNNAVNDITATALAGDLWNGNVLLTETSIDFTATGLVPTFVPPPVPLTIGNIEDWSGSV